MFVRWACCLLIVAGSLNAFDPHTANSEPTKESTELDDPVLPLTPAHPRTEAEQDHLDALANFAAGRMAQQREDNAEALRRYQRAYRYDPDATLVLRDIVPLAFSLDRSSVAVRYALIAVEKDPTDPLLLRRMAAYLADDGERDKALALYEKSRELAAAAHEKPNSTAILTAMEMGRLYYLAEKYDKAADRFAEVMQALEKPAEFGIDATVRKAMLGSSDVAYQLFGEAFLDAGRNDDAVKAFAKANEIKPDASRAAFNEARVEFKRGKHDAALVKLNQVFAAKRHDLGVTPYQLLADILAAQDNSAQLLPQLEKLRAADGEDIPLRFFLAERYREAKELDKAEPIYRELLKLSPDRPPIEAFQGLVSIYIEQQKTAVLLDTLSSAVGKAGSLDALGEAAKKLAANPEALKAVIELAKSRHQADAAQPDFGARLAVAQLLLGDKQFDDADRWFDLALAVKGDRSVDFLLSWGLDLFLKERYASAAKIFRHAIDAKLLPTNAAALHYYLAGALEMDGKTDDAVAAAKAGAALQPDSARFASRPPWILYHAKRQADAQREYRALLDAFDEKHDTNDTRDVMRDARLVLSNIAVEQGKIAEAEDWLEQVLDEFPGDIGALNDLGYLFADQGKHLGRALRMTQQAVAAEPKNAAYRDSLGWALYQLGRADEAVAELQQALSLDEHPDGVLYDHLGDALLKAGKPAEAKDAWTKAIAAFEKSGDTPKIAKTKEKLSKS